MEMVVSQQNTSLEMIVSQFVDIYISDLIVIVYPVCTVCQLPLEVGSVGVLDWKTGTIMHKTSTDGLGTRCVTEYCLAYIRQYQQVKSMELLCKELGISQRTMFRYKQLLRKEKETAKDLLKDVK